MGDEMATAPMSYTSQSAGTATSEQRSSESEHRDRPMLGLEGELADLYAAIVVVVPLAFFLRWLWP